MQRLAFSGRTGVFLTALVIILAALLAPGWIGALLTVVIIALLIALMRRTWAFQTPRTRAMRLGVLVILFAFAVYKASH